jgi:hypothetical protein
MGKSLPQYRDALRLDLKDPAALWSDAELNRCVERAVEDMSRYLPLEQVYEDTLNQIVTDEELTTPANAVATSIVNAADISATVSGGTLTLASKKLTVPSRLTVTLTDANASITALTLIVKGYDRSGYYIQESWYLKDLTTATAIQGNLYFKYVSEVEVDNIAGNGAADTLSVGNGQSYDSYAYMANYPIKPGTETIKCALGALAGDSNAPDAGDLTLLATYIATPTAVPAGSSLTLKEFRLRADANGDGVIDAADATLIGYYVIGSVTQDYHTFVRGTDYTIDYINGRIKWLTAGSMSSAKYLISYTKSKLGVNISSVLPSLTRITSVEYPCDQIPQKFVSYSVFGDFLYVGSMSNKRGQEELLDAQHLAIYYERPHTAPGEVGPGSYPAVLDEVVAIGAGAYAMLVKSAQCEHQAITDITSSRTAMVTIIAAIHVLIDTALDKVTTYVTDMDTALDAFVTAIGTNPAAALAKVETNVALAKAAFALALDTSIATDLTTLGTSITAVGTLQASGDDYIPTVNLGASVPENYNTYAQTQLGIASAMVSAINARISRINSYIAQGQGYNQAAAEYVAEAQGRTSLAEAYISESQGRYNMAMSFVQEAQARTAEIDRMLNEANQYQLAANLDITLSDKFRAEAIERRNEFMSILAQKSEYRKRLSGPAALQQPI